jgi:hypothetical protein
MYHKRNIPNISGPLNLGSAEHNQQSENRGQSSFQVSFVGDVVVNDAEDFNSFHQWCRVIRAEANLSSSIISNWSSVSDISRATISANDIVGSLSSG